jgi:hypothetical protein
VADAKVPTSPLLVVRRVGTFKATGENWTIAQVRRLSDTDGERAQVSYGRSESVFRPERFAWGDIVLLALLAPSDAVG